MIIWGMSKNGHDWGLSIFKNNKHVKTITGKGLRHSSECMTEASPFKPDLVVWYENPYLKSTRQFLAGQSKPFSRNNISAYLKSLHIKSKWTYVSHHRSHAAQYYNSGFEDATVVVIDSIGEFDCTSIWKAEGNNLTKIKSVKYPHSIGLFYSAMTQRAGLIPQQDEGKFDKISNTSPILTNNVWEMERDFIKTMKPLPKFKVNFHKGIRDYSPQYDDLEIAVMTKNLFENMITQVLRTARESTKSKNIVICGGVALNSTMPRLVGNMWDNLYIPQNPSDSGSAEGAVLAYLRKKTLIDIFPYGAGFYP